ncbi:MAG: protoporphyrinogen oxidase [Bdellovibrionota bacterium]
MSTSDVIVVGAGIGGLALAYALEKGGLQVTVLEAGDAPGGAIRSERRDGFLLEWGANSVMPKHRIVDLAGELGLTDELVEADPAAKKRFVVVRDPGLQLSAAPISLAQLVSTNIISGRAKLRLLLEPFVAGRCAEDESVADFFERRFGPEFTQTISTLLNGIWAGDINSMSMRSTLPAAWDLDRTRRSVILGLMFGKRTRPRPGGPQRLFTFRDGMQTLPRRLLQKLQKSEVVLGGAASRIELADGSATVHTTSSSYTARVVCLATDSRNSAQLLAECVPQLSALVQSVPYAPLGILHLAFAKRDVPQPLDGFGFLAPSGPELGILGAIFSSSLFPDRAPADTHLLTCFCGGATNPDLADVKAPETQRRISAEVVEILAARGAPKVVSATYLPRAVPNYPCGHFRLQQAVARVNAEHHSLKLLGNWCSGISVPDRVEEGLALADGILETFGRKKE